MEANLTANLKRKLGLWEATAVSVGATIGSGIFSSIGEVAGASGSVTIIILAFFLGGLLNIPANLVYAELATAYPENGGHYIYFRESGSKPLAFWSGWISFWATDSPSMAIMSIAIVNYLNFFVKMSGITPKIIATILVLIFMFVHMRSVEGGSKFNTFLTFFKILPFVLIIGLGIFSLRPELHSATTLAGSNSALIALFAGISATTWSFDGMCSVCYMTEEIKDPKKTMPKALIITAVGVTALYVLLSYVVTGLLPLQQLASSQAPIAEAVKAIPFFGSIASKFVAIMAIIVIIGSMSSSIMYQPRLQYAMAKDGLWFPKFGEVHPKWETPAVSIMAQCLYSIVLIFATNISELLGYFTLVALVRNLLIFGTIFVLRKKENYNPLWKMPAGYFMAGIAMLVTGILIWSTFTWAPKAGLIAGVLSIVTAIPAYIFFERRYGSKVAK